VQVPLVIESSTSFLLLAILAFTLVGRFAHCPFQFYRTLAGIALFLSFSTPIMAMMGMFAVPRMIVHIFWTMIVVHLVSAVITVGLLRTQAGKVENRNSQQ